VCSGHWSGKPEYGCLLAETLSSEGCTIGQILVSHHHHDHVGGIVQIKTLCDRDVPGELPPFARCLFGEIVVRYYDCVPLQFTSAHTRNPLATMSKHVFLSVMVRSSSLKGPHCVLFTPQATLQSVPIFPCVTCHLASVISPLWTLMLMAHTGFHVVCVAGRG
jgi:hypothetical protein